jgi:pentatricopeptide repeat protein
MIYMTQGGEWERGLALLARMARAGLEPNIICYNAALHGCAKAGAAERAQTLLEVYKHTYVYVYTNNVTYAYAHVRTCMHTPV